MKNHPNSSYYKNKYKTYRNVLSKLLKSAKKHYYTNKIRMSFGNTNKTWAVINELLNKTPQKIVPTLLKSNTHNTLPVTDKFEIAEKFNDFFINIGPNLSSNITSNTHFTQYLKGNYLNSFFFRPVNEQAVMKELNNLNPRKSVGLDKMHPQLIRHAANIIARPLTHIINCSLSQGIFPDPLKVAKIIPIYKKGAATDVSNYRPISILSIFSKIFESFVNKQLINYLESNHVLLDTQFGFRKKYSTKLALIDLISEICDNLDKGVLTFGVFIDLKKAFDTINHDILLKKLEHYGIRGLPLKWFTNYLTHRKQSVHINAASSNDKDVQCGIPQGSILGPILFLIYINDISNSTNSFHFRLFADDTNLFKFLKDKNINLNQINSDLNLVYEWCNSNKLTINTDKTKYMIIKTSQKNVNIEGDLGIDGSPIEGVKSAMYLGVSIDNNITWKSHIQNVVKSIAPKVGIISRIRHYLPKSALILIYNSLILPHLSYCIEIWGNTYTSYLNPLYVLQKKIVRLINFENYRAPTSPLFKKLEILPIHKLCKYNTCVFTFDLLNNNLPHPVHRYLDPLPHKYVTRSASQENFYIPRTTLTQNKHNLKNAATHHWNNLPSHIKLLRNRKSFKKSLKLHLINND